MEMQPASPRQTGGTRQAESALKASLAKTAKTADLEGSGEENDSGCGLLVVVDDCTVKAPPGLPVHQGFSYIRAVWHNASFTPVMTPHGAKL